MHARLGTGIALASMTALLLVGCTPDAPVETTSPTDVQPTPTDELTEQEVLNDAFAVTQEFYALVDQGFASGELPQSSLQHLATAEAIAKVQTELDQFTGLGWTIDGVSILDTPTLASWDRRSETDGAAELLVCLDTSNVVTTSANGEPVAGGEPRQPRLFTVEYDDSGMLVADLIPVDESTELAGCGS